MSDAASSPRRLERMQRSRRYRGNATQTSAATSGNLLPTTHEQGDDNNDVHTQVPLSSSYSNAVHYTMKSSHDSVEPLPQSRAASAAVAVSPQFRNKALQRYKRNVATGSATGSATGTGTGTSTAKAAGNQTATTTTASAASSIASLTSQNSNSTRLSFTTTASSASGTSLDAQKQQQQQQQPQPVPNQPEDVPRWRRNYPLQAPFTSTTTEAPANVSATTNAIRTAQSSTHDLQSPSRKQYYQSIVLSRRHVPLAAATKIHSTATETPSSAPSSPLHHPFRGARLTDNVNTTSSSQSLTSASLATAAKLQKSWIASTTKATKTLTNAHKSQLDEQDLSQTEECSVTEPHEDDTAPHLEIETTRSGPPLRSAWSRSTTPRAAGAPATAQLATSSSTTTTNTTPSNTRSGASKVRNLSAHLERHGLGQQQQQHPADDDLPSVHLLRQASREQDAVSVMTLETAWTSKSAALQQQPPPPQQGTSSSSNIRLCAMRQTGPFNGSSNASAASQSTAKTASRSSVQVIQHWNRQRTASTNGNGGEVTAEAQPGAEASPPAMVAAEPDLSTQPPPPLTTTGSQDRQAIQQWKRHRLPQPQEQQDDATSMGSTSHKSVLHRWNPKGNRGEPDADNVVNEQPLNNQDHAPKEIHMKDEAATAEPARPLPLILSHSSNTEPVHDLTSYSPNSSAHIVMRNNGRINNDSSSQNNKSATAAPRAAAASLPYPKPVHARANASPRWGKPNNNNNNKQLFNTKPLPPSHDEEQPKPDSQTATALETAPHRVSVTGIASRFDRQGPAASAATTSIAATTRSQPTPVAMPLQPTQAPLPSSRSWTVPSSSGKAIIIAADGNNDETYGFVDDSALALPTVDVNITIERPEKVSVLDMKARFATNTTMTLATTPRFTNSISSRQRQPPQAGVSTNTHPSVSVTKSKYPSSPAGLRASSKVSIKPLEGSKASIAERGADSEFAAGVEEEERITTHSDIADREVEVTNLRAIIETPTKVSVSSMKSVFGGQPNSQRSNWNPPTNNINNGRTFGARPAQSAPSTPTPPHASAPQSRSGHGPDVSTPHAPSPPNRYRPTTDSPPTSPPALWQQRQPVMPGSRHLAALSKSEAPRVEIPVPTKAMSPNRRLPLSPGLAALAPASNSPWRSKSPLPLSAVEPFISFSMAKRTSPNTRKTSPAAPPAEFRALRQASPASASGASPVPSKQRSSSSPRERPVGTSPSRAAQTVRPSDQRECSPRRMVDSSHNSSVAMHSPFSETLDDPMEASSPPSKADIGLNPPSRSEYRGEEQPMVVVVVVDPFLPSREHLSMPHLTLEQDSEHQELGDGEAETGGDMDELVKRKAFDASFVETSGNNLSMSYGSSPSSSTRSKIRPWNQELEISADSTKGLPSASNPCKWQDRSRSSSSDPSGTPNAADGAATSRRTTPSPNNKTLPTASLPPYQDVSYAEEKKTGSDDDGGLDLDASPNSLSRMAADSIHAVDFDAAMMHGLIGPSNSMDDDCDVLSYNSSGISGAIPKDLPPDIAQALDRSGASNSNNVNQQAAQRPTKPDPQHPSMSLIFGSPETFGAAGGEETAEPPPVAERARAIASWRGGLGIAKPVSSSQNAKLQIYSDPISEASELSYTDGEGIEEEPHVIVFGDPNTFGAAGGERPGHIPPVKQRRDAIQEWTGGTGGGKKNANSSSNVDASAAQRTQGASAVLRFWAKNESQDDLGSRDDGETAGHDGHHQQHGRYHRMEAPLEHEQHFLDQQDRIRNNSSTNEPSPKVRVYQIIEPPPIFATSDTHDEEDTIGLDGKPPVLAVLPSPPIMMVQDIPPMRKNMSGVSPSARQRKHAPPPDPFSPETVVSFTSKTGTRLDKNHSKRLHDFDPFGGDDGDKGSDFVGSSNSHVNHNDFFQENESDFVIASSRPNSFAAFRVTPLGPIDLDVTVDSREAAFGNSFEFQNESFTIPPSSPDPFFLPAAPPVTAAHDNSQGPFFGSTTFPRINVGPKNEGVESESSRSAKSPPKRRPVVGATSNPARSIPGLSPPPITKSRKKSSSTSTSRRHQASQQQGRKVASLSRQQNFASPPRIPSRPESHPQQQLPPKSFASTVRRSDPWGYEADNSDLNDSLHIEI